MIHNRIDPDKKTLSNRIKKSSKFFEMLIPATLSEHNNMVLAKNDVFLNT